MKIAAVVVTFNRLALLQQNIAALRSQTAPCDVLVVDNASEDGTADAMLPLQESGKLFYFNTGSNLGGAGGFSFGMKKAVELGYDYIWVMDDDCIPAPNALEELLKADRFLGGASNYGFLSSAVLWKDGTDCVMNRQKRIPEKLRSPEQTEKGIIPILQATFVSLFFPKETLLQLGLPIRDFFIWGDDIEYTRRIAIRNHMPAYLVKNSEVVHLTANNAGSNIGLDAPERIDRYYYAYRNEVYLHRMEGLKGWLLYIGKRCRDVLRIIFLAKSHRLKRLKVLFRGIADGLRFHPTVEYIPGNNPKEREAATWRNR